MPRDYSTLTHVHLRNVLATHLQVRDEPLRVLDFGSGSAVLTTYLQRTLPSLGFDVEMYGLDVNDRQVQRRQFHQASILRAQGELPNYPWEERLALIGSDDKWPYPDDFFDGIVSNQVFEHVHDPQAELAELSRTLKPAGYSSHLFPFRSCTKEGHLLVPLAHRISDSAIREGWIKTYYSGQKRLGRGKYRRDAVPANWSVEDYAGAHADNLVTETHYESFRAFAAMAALQGLRVDFDYTTDFYGLKLKQIRGRDLSRSYERGAPFAKSLTVHLLKFVGGVSVGIQHADRYAAWRDRAC